MVAIYSKGPIFMSVCTDEEPEAMLAEVNLREPAGTDDGWQIAPDARFHGGQSNPCPCHDHPETHRHYLLAAQPLATLFDKLWPRQASTT